MVSMSLFAGTAIFPSSLPLTSRVADMETSRSVADNRSVFFAKSNRIFSRIGRVDLEGTTPFIHVKAFCNSELATVNFIQISLKKGCFLGGALGKTTKIYVYLQLEIWLWIEHKCPNYIIVIVFKNKRIVVIKVLVVWTSIKNNRKGDGEKEKSNSWIFFRV